MRFDMQKLFFFILSLFSIYAMEEQKIEKLFLPIFPKQNITFIKALEHATQNPSQEAFKEIENCLNQGADINSIVGYNGETPIIWAVANFKKELFDFLLQKGADINACDNLERTPLHIILRNQKLAQLANFDIEKDFLKRGTNIHAKKNGDTLLDTAIQLNVIEAIKLLIKYGAKINEYDDPWSKWTPLKLAIQNKNFEATKELCKLGASLMHIDFYGSNAFHVAIEDKLPKNYINLFITNMCLDVYNKEIDEQLEKKVITAYLALEKSNIFSPPKEVQIIILSYLALDYLYGFNKKFCQWLVKKDKDPFLIHTYRRVNYLEQILQSTDNDGKTALQTLYNKHQNDLLYIQDVESLVDVEKLQQDRIDFINGTTQQNNLVAKIYEHSRKLLFES